MWRAYERAGENGRRPSTLVEPGSRASSTTASSTCFVNQTYSVMSNDVLTAIPLFLFMGYIVERANIVDRLFTTLFIATRRVPGSMAVAALVTCTLFATATGIVGAVVTLMGLLAFPAMLKARYDISFAAGVICAGGTLGILIPPSIMLIVYARHLGRLGRAPLRRRAPAGLPARRPLYRLRGHPRRRCSPSLAPKPRPEDIGDTSLRFSRLDAADLLRAAGAADPRGARRDPLRPRDAVGGGGDRRARRPAARRRLPGADLAAAARVGLSDRPHLGDGLLALRRLGDLRLGLRLSRRRSS